MGAEIGGYHGNGVRRAIRDSSYGNLLDLHGFHIQRVLLGSIQPVWEIGLPVSGPPIRHR